jgi:thiol:disulfide interchange protein
MTPSGFRGLALFALVLVAVPAACSEAPRGSDSSPEALVWTPFSAEAFDRARRSGAPFVIEFGADWCAPCKEMKERTFTDPLVREAAEGVTLLTVDMTEPDDFITRVLRSFDVIAAPTTIVFGPDGKEWKRRGGFIGPDEFVRLLNDSWGDVRRRPNPEIPTERT